MRQKVTVTATDLSFRDRRAGHWTLDCPVGRACRRDIGDPFLGVRGNGEVVVRSRRDRLGVTARLSPDDRAAVRAAVEAIDQGFGDTVRPFSFTAEWDP